MVLRSVQVPGFGVIHVSTSRDAVAFASPAPSSSLLCALCRDVPRVPRRASCGHVLCLHCARARVAASPTCPSCSSKCDLSDLIVDDALTLDVENLMTHCAHAFRVDALGTGTATAGATTLDFRGFGARACGAVVRFGDLERHQSSCEFRIVRCGARATEGEERCDAACVARELGKHREACAYVARRCENLGCAWVGSAMYASKHNEVCEKKPVKCAHGCGATTRDESSRARHEETCPAKDVACGNVDDEDEDDASRTCPAIMKRHGLALHRENVCEHARLSVPCVDCQRFVAKRSAIRHAQTCPKRKTRCPAGCGAVVAKDRERTHLESECAFVEVQCEFHEVGCLFRSARGAMPRHCEEANREHCALVLKAAVEVRDASAEVAKSCEIVARDDFGFTASEREERDVVLRALLDEEIRALEDMKALREDEAERRRRGVMVVDALTAAIADHVKRYDAVIANVCEDITKMRAEFEAYKTQNALELESLREAVAATQLAARDVASRVSTLSRGGGIVEELRDKMRDDLKDERASIIGEIEKRSRSLRFELDDIKTEQNAQILRLREDIRAVLKQ